MNRTATALLVVFLGFSLACTGGTQRERTKEKSLLEGVVPINVAQADTTADTFKLYVKGSLSGHYNYQYTRKKDQYLSVRMRDIKTFDSGHLMVDRSSNAFKEVWDVLKDGEDHTMILTAKITQRSSGFFEPVVIISIK